MHVSTLASIVCLIAGAVSIFVGEQALAEARDLAALYWLGTGAVTLKASLTLAQRPPS